MTKNLPLECDGDGVDRRGFLHCMAWAGAGVAWTMRGGVLSSRVFGQATASDPGDVEIYQQQLTAIRNAALHGADARQLLDGIAVEDD